MRYGSICSGVEAASLAWAPLGWQCAFMSEIEAFPRAVLAHRYHDVPLHGDFTTIREGEYEPIDLLVGGTPCQSFSVAGLRGGLADDRGNLALEYLRLADRLRPRWLVWENVPGVLSSNGGRDFGAILGGMVELGYGFAYRVLDAQYVRVDGFARAVPQRRRRVFVVGYLGDWRRAAAVLFERESLSGNPPPRREAGQGTARDVAPSLTISGRGVERAGETRGQDPVVAVPAVSPALKARDAKGPSSDGDGDGAPLIAHALRGDGFDASEGGTGRGTPLVPVAYRTSGNCGAWETGDTTDALTTGTDPNHHVLAFSSKDHGADAGLIAPTLRSMGHDGSHANGGGQVAVAFSIMPMNSGKDYKARQTEVAQPLMAGGPVGGNQGGDFIAQPYAVRRLTPVECERLQGMPDNYTLVPYRNGMAADGPRYKAIGNSMAVNVMRRIGQKIEAVEAINQQEAA